jgi:hypothetical protein
MPGFNASDIARSIYQGFAAKVNFSSGSTASTTVVAAKTGFTPYLTKFIHSVTADGTASILVQDTQTTASVFVKTVASPGFGVREYGFGDEGLALTESYGVVVTISGSSAQVSNVVVEGYLKQTSPLTPSQL